MSAILRDRLSWCQQCSDAKLVVLLLFHRPLHQLRNLMSVGTEDIVLAPCEVRMHLSW
jgi:hypothetical protein